MASGSAHEQLSTGSPGKTSKFVLTGDHIVVERARGKKLQAPLYNVLWAALEGDQFALSFLVRRKPGASLSLARISVRVEDEKKAEATTFAESLMDKAYAGTKRRRRLKVLINPGSGPGRGRAMYNKIVEPILRAAQSEVDAVFTTGRWHAQKLMSELPLDTYDAVVSMSGDGLIHEIVNGFAEHSEPMRAFRTPIAPIPVGSGNALSLNLLGLQDGLDVAAATLNAVKGRPMASDVFSVVQSGKRYLSFMTHAMGLMADLDVGTEHLRFLGSGRFVVGFIHGVLRHKSCPIKVHLKVAESDKLKMVADLNAARTAALAVHAKHPNDTGEVESAHGPGLPPLRFDKEPHDGPGWITVDDPLLYVYAGQGPYVSQDLMEFPVSQPSDGLIDVICRGLTTRADCFKHLGDGTTGAPYWDDAHLYYKVHAYRIEPLADKGALSIDGENYPFEPYHAEVHQGLATCLSPTGWYSAEFDVPPEMKMPRK